MSEGPEPGQPQARRSPSDLLPPLSLKDLFPALAVVVTVGLIAPQDVHRWALSLLQSAAGHGVVLAWTAVADMVLCGLWTWKYYPAPLPKDARRSDYSRRERWVDGCMQMLSPVLLTVSGYLVLVGLAWLVRTLLPDLGSPWLLSFAAGIFMALALVSSLRLPAGIVRVMWYLALAMLPVGTYLHLAGHVPSW